MYSSLVKLSASIAAFFASSFLALSQQAESNLLTRSSIGYSFDAQVQDFTVGTLLVPHTDPTNRYSSDPNAIELGKLLFFDRGLSKNKDVSCATCHDPKAGWSFPRSKFPTISKREVPSLLNISLSRWFSWDGKADSLWSQSLLPIEAEDELGSDRISTVRYILKSHDLSELYTSAFPNYSIEWCCEQIPEFGGPQSKAASGISNWSSMPIDLQEQVNRAFVNVGKALAAFQTTIISEQTAFDKYVLSVSKSDKNSGLLSDSAERGIALFVKSGCATCHYGPRLSDEEFHDLGLLPARDPGRYAGIKAVLQSEFNLLSAYADGEPSSRQAHTRFLSNDFTKHSQFKTPTLRGLLMTAPYMHDGRFASLDEVLEFYSTLNGSRRTGHNEGIIQPLFFTEDEKGDLLEFLKALSTQ